LPSNVLISAVAHSKAAQIRRPSAAAGAVDANAIAATPDWARAGHQLPVAVDCQPIERKKKISFSAEMRFQAREVSKSHSVQRITLGTAERA
jgi:hypothetical protein